MSIFIVWVLLPQFRSFPKDGTLAERDAWTEQHVPEYASLKRTIGKIPTIRESVGRIVGIAPAGGAKHIAASDMDGVGMNFTLDVVGEKGSGVLRVDCGVDGDQVYRWEPAIWTFNGRRLKSRLSPISSSVGVEATRGAHVHGTRIAVAIPFDPLKRPSFVGRRTSTRVPAAERNSLIFISAPAAPNLQDKCLWLTETPSSSSVGRPQTIADTGFSQNILRTFRVDLDLLS